MPPILVPRTPNVEDPPMLIDLNQEIDLTAPENTSAPQIPPTALQSTSLLHSPYTPMDSPTTPPGYMSEDGDNNDNLSNYYLFLICFDFMSCLLYYSILFS